jgi:hypothetical protein
MPNPLAKVDQTIELRNFAVKIAELYFVFDVSVGVELAAREIVPRCFDDLPFDSTRCFVGFATTLSGEKSFCLIIPVATDVCCAHDGVSGLAGDTARENRARLSALVENNFNKATFGVDDLSG